MLRSKFEGIYSHVLHESKWKEIRDKIQEGKMSPEVGRILVDIRFIKIQMQYAQFFGKWTFWKKSKTEELWKEYEENKKKYRELMGTDYN